jgi:hypothetical protein
VSPLLFLQIPNILDKRLFVRLHCALARMTPARGKINDREEERRESEREEEEK